MLLGDLKLPQHPHSERNSKAMHTHSAPMPPLAAKPFPLSMAVAGESLVIAEIRGGHRLLERLLAMGLGFAEEMQVVQRIDHGGVVVAKNGTRYALGGGMAHKIYVVRN